MDDSVTQQVLLEELEYTYNKYINVDPMDYNKAMGLTIKMQRLRKKLEAFEPTLTQANKNMILKTKGVVRGD